MTLTQIAINAANSLRINGRSNIALRNSIEERWNLLWVPNRQSYYPEDDCVLINDTAYHSDDTITCDRCNDTSADSCRVQSRMRGRLVQQYWCEACSDDYAFWCTGCDERFEDGEACPHEGENYCQNCYENIERNEVPSYHSAKRWIPYDDSVPLYSFELELEANDRSELVEHLSLLAYPKVSWEMDGSLDRAKGLEILIQLRESADKLADDTCNLIANIKKKGFGLSSWNNGKCGAHLNSNRSEKWTLKAIMRLIYCVRSAKDYLIRISGRESNHWASWDSRGMELKRQAYGNLGKYTMLRIGSDRFEWRMFRGTLKEERIRLYCETVKQFEALALSDVSIFNLKQAAIELGKTLANSI